MFFSLSLLMLLTSCGESAKEKAEREKLEKKEQIEKATAKIIVTYNDAIAAHKRNVEKVKESYRFWSNYGQKGVNALKTINGNYEQRSWDTTYVYFKLDSMENSFKERFGEDDYNVLRLKIDDNFNEKIK